MKKENFQTMMSNEARMIAKAIMYRDFSSSEMMEDEETLLGFMDMVVNNMDNLNFYVELLGDDTPDIFTDIANVIVAELSEYVSDTVLEYIHSRYVINN